MHRQGRRLHKTSRWSQLIALCLGQLGKRHSLRDIESNMNAQTSRLYHLGAQPVARSSLPRLNRQQPHTLYEALFSKLYARCRELALKNRFRFKNRLYSLHA